MKKDIYRLKEFISYNKIAKIPLTRFSVADVNDYASMLRSLKWSASDIRKFLKDNPKFRKHRYVFEVYFQLGILKNDLQYCTLKYLDKSGEKWFFKKPDGDKIMLNDFMKQLIKEYQNNQETAYMENNRTVNYYLRQISEELRDQGYFPFDNNLVLDDIKKTRKHFFMTCPNCGETFESFADNWVLAKAETDSNYHLVCKVCKGEPQYENKCN